MTPSEPTLYLVSNAHLDTAWIWDIRTVIDHYLPATTRDNFALFEEFPHYTFNFEGSFRYRLIKEYYPDDWRRLKQYVQQGRWAVCGSSVDAGDVNVPAAESIIRHVLYGNGFFRRELGVESTDIFLPDCFGFGYALPSIAAHCGLKGFSTQKLTWGVWTEVPFELGRWTGPDGASIVASLKSGDYTWKVGPGFDADPGLLRCTQENRSACGVPVAFRYFGTGDRGGSPGAYSCANIEAAMAADGPCEVQVVKADRLFNELTPQQVAAMPGYTGELLMTAHGTGCYTTQAALKRLNRANERIAHAADSGLQRRSRSWRTAQCACPSKSSGGARGRCLSNGSRWTARPGQSGLTCSPTWTGTRPMRCSRRHSLLPPTTHRPRMTWASV